MLYFFNRKINRLARGVILDDYTLYDQFTTALAAGSVNATNAEPVGGARTVTDTNSKISIASGVLSFALGAATDNGIWWGTNTRVLGKALLGNFFLTDNTQNIYFGWDANQATGITDAINFNSSAGVLKISSSFTDITVDAYSAANYVVALIMRATGMFYFIRGGAFTNWALLYTSLAVSSAGFPGIRLNNTHAFTADNIRVPKRLFIPVPLQSDGMSAATTDGAGNAEANGAAGNAYTNVGTWGVAAGVRSCSVLSGGVGFSYLPCTSSNVVMDAAVTRTGDNAGIVARYADANNYLIAYTEGTNAVCVQVVAGTPTTLRTGAVTYGAGNVLRLILDGTAGRLFYNNLAVGAVFTVPASTSLNHGLYTSNTGNTFDNLVIWARGNEGQYGGLDSL